MKSVYQEIKKSVVPILAGSAVVGLILGVDVPPHLEIVTDVSNIIDAKEFVEDGVEIVQYAYKDAEIVGTLVENEIVEQRTSSSFVEDLGSNTHRLRAYSGSNFFEEEGTWYQIEYATTTREVYESEVAPLAWLFGEVAYAQTTIFSGAGDGRVAYDDISSDGWTVAHDATTGTDFAYTGAFVSAPFVGEEALSVDNYDIHRAFLPFDTSTIPSDGIVSSATLNIKITSKLNGDNDGDDWINVVQTSQADETTLATADYDQAGSIDNPTEGATRIDITDIAADSTYVTWALNATGLSWIKKDGEAANCGATAGWTCLGLREGHDAIDSPVANSTDNQITFTASETSGTASDPYLEITYSVPDTLSAGFIIR